MPPQIISLTQTLLASGLPSAPSIYPLVSLNPDNPAASQYRLAVQIYLTDTSTAEFSTDITTIIHQSNNGITIDLREFNIQYTDTANPPTTTYSLWLFDIIYNINDGPSAQGILVQVTWAPPINPDPGGGIPTTRGTVTMVATT
ncbi:MAG TPA: hypothetical protein VNS58_12590 [Puia sp.]|nr:hypothetical protein [Puia sp.]